MLLLPSLIVHTLPLPKLKRSLSITPTRKPARRTLHLWRALYGEASHCRLLTASIVYWACSVTLGPPYSQISDTGLLSVSPCKRPIVLSYRRRDPEPEGASKWAYRRTGGPWGHIQQSKGADTIKAQSYSGIREEKETPNSPSRSFCGIHSTSLVLFPKLLGTIPENLKAKIWYI